jgi:hypothetical protein
MYTNFLNTHTYTQAVIGVLKSTGPLVPLTVLLKIMTTNVKNFSLISRIRMTNSGNNAKLYEVRNSVLEIILLRQVSI